MIDGSIGKKERKVMNYFGLLWVYIKKSIIRDLEYRTNMVTNLLTDFIFNLLKIVLVDIIFYNISEIAGFSKYEIMFIFGMSFIVLSIYMTFNFTNHIQLPANIQNGNLDLSLTKPISFFFEISFKNFNIAGLGSAIYGWFIVMNASQKLNLSWDMLTVLLFLLFIFCGYLVYFSISLIVYTFGFWTVKTNGFIDIIVDLGEVMKYPYQIFPKAIQIFLSFIIPIFMVASFPSEIIFHKIEYINTIYLVIISLLSFLASRLFLSYAIKKYASASC